VKLPPPKNGSPEVKKKAEQDSKAPRKEALGGNHQSVAARRIRVALPCRAFAAVAKAKPLVRRAQNLHLLGKFRSSDFGRY
jgi:hypothetical protein